jgi:signal transduction histidine kinase
MVYTVSASTINDAIHRDTLYLALFGLGALLTATIVSYIFINWFILAPMAAVSRQAQIISGGNLEQQVLSKRHDEIGGLANAVNSMAQALKGDIRKLQELDKAKTEFMMITSHNLRTPLTIISGYLENAQSLKTPEQYDIAFKNIAIGAQRLSTFAEDVLSISQLELGQQIVQLSENDITSILHDIAKEFEPSARLKGVMFQASFGGLPEHMLLDRLHLRSALFNILDNALKFTPKDGSMTLSATVQNSNVVIQIADTGIGISAEEQSKLFTKFHRGTSTYNYSYEGVGIGLYASKMMIDGHGGSIRVNSTEGNGSTFIITLPIQHKNTDQ